MVKPIPSLPAALDQFAILLDVDGTILDLAPTPREVFVSHTRCATRWHGCGNARTVPWLL